MTENSWNHRVSPAKESGDAGDDGHEGRPEVIIAMGMAGLSGFVGGLFLRGELIGIAVCILLALFCGCVGWWARGLMR